MLAGIAAALLVILVPACGGGDGASEVETDGPPRAIPACAKGAPAVPSPAALPSNFPLPPGTVITSAESPHPTQLVIAGVIPADLQDATAFFNEMLPERGYKLGVGDAEGNESEAPFTGNGYRGKWRVNQLIDCPALTLTLVLIEQS